MAAIVFDVREAERRLLDAGASPEVAEATADLMSEAVIHNLDALVTRDYLDHALDARFAQQDARIDRLFHQQDAKFDRLFQQQDAKFDQRFQQQDAKFDQRFQQQDAKFDQQEAKFEQRFHQQEAKFEQRFHELETRMLELKGQFRVMQAIQALLVAGVFLPQLRSLF